MLKQGRRPLAQLRRSHSSELEAQEVEREEHNQQGQSDHKERKPAKPKTVWLVEMELPSIHRWQPGLQALEFVETGSERRRGKLSNVEHRSNTGLDAVHHRTGLCNDTATRVLGSSSLLPQRPPASHGDRRRNVPRRMAGAVGWIGESSWERVTWFTKRMPRIAGAVENTELDSMGNEEEQGARRLSLPHSEEDNRIKTTTTHVGQDDDHPTDAEERICRSLLMLARRSVGTTRTCHMWQQVGFVGNGERGLQGERHQRKITREEHKCDFRIQPGLSSDAMPGHPSTGQAKRQKTAEDQSSIPSQPALASKDDHSCTMRPWSDTALS